MPPILKSSVDGDHQPGITPIDTQPSRMCDIRMDPWVGSRLPAVEASEKMRPVTEQQSFAGDPLQLEYEKRLAFEKSKVAACRAPHES
jgi:hypothetical protein